MTGAAELAAYGAWARAAGYGDIWYPDVPAGWAPYREGYWAWVEPWGWSWVDDEPWGFAPFHYGRWATVEDQWAWVPGEFVPQPVYAPALVAFVGAPGTGYWNAGDVGPAVGWFPLGPGEVYWPSYTRNRDYIRNINIANVGRAVIDPIAPGLFRRQVLRGADDLRRLGHRGLRVADRSGDAEVHHLHVAGPGQHHVAGLDVPVHDAVLVAVVQRPQHPVGDLQGAVREQPPVVPEQVAQGPAVDVLHNDVGHRGRADHVLAGVVDRHDARVVERRGGLGLTAEPGLEGLVPGQVVAQGLHRDDAVETDIAGPEHLGHAAAPDDPVELVAAAE